MLATFHNIAAKLIGIVKVIRLAIAVLVLLAGYLLITSDHQSLTSHLITCVVAILWLLLANIFITSFSSIKLPDNPDEKQPFFTRIKLALLGFVCLLFCLLTLIAIVVTIRSIKLTLFS